MDHESPNPYARALSVREISTKLILWLCRGQSCYIHKYGKCFLTSSDSHKKQSRNGPHSGQAWSMNYVWGYKEFPSHRLPQLQYHLQRLWQRRSWSALLPQSYVTHQSRRTILQSNRSRNDKDKKKRKAEESASDEDKQKTVKRLMLLTLTPWRWIYISTYLARELPIPFAIDSSVTLPIDPTLLSLTADNLVALNPLNHFDHLNPNINC